jgi:hypothetical protein
MHASAVARHGDEVDARARPSDLARHRRDVIRPVRALRASGYIRWSLRSTAQPLYTREFLIILGSCFSRVTIGLIPIRAHVREADFGAGQHLGVDVNFILTPPCIFV